MHTGAKLGHYEILSAIGRGAMGEVWKARDTRLQREVAVKALPPEFAQHPDRLARLEREAQSLAAVNHPNIASVYGLEEQAAARYIVLELVPGETLAERLHKGAVPLDQALRLALQIAEALEAAHEKNVIHRDLKPANIKVTPEGRVKVLDFGLAKVLPVALGASGPALTMQGDAPGLMGTPAYMSPEQARGEIVDRRADIWSFGVVLYEMLTGDSPFDRGTVTETLARVLEVQPDLAALPPSTPASLRHLLKRCLEKDRKRRLQHIGDARIDLEDTIAVLGTELAPTRSTGRTRRMGAAAVALSIGFVALAGVAGVGAWLFLDGQASEATGHVVRLTIPSLGARLTTPVGSASLAISPDGERVAYSGSTGLLVRRLRESQAIAIGRGGTNPFFSPDGEWLGFFSNGIYKVPSAGGGASLIVETTERPLGASWGVDDTIVFATTSGLYAAAGAGGGARLLAAPNAERGELLAFPHVMPDARSVLFTIVRTGSLDAAQIALLDLQTLATKTIVAGGTSGEYAATGHIVYASGGALRAIAFDLDAREADGEAVAIADIAVRTAPDNGAADFALSATGTLLSIPPASARVAGRPAWIDRQGNEEPLPLEPGSYLYPRVSPDGTRVAFDVGGANRDIWILDLERSSYTRLTNGPLEEMMPLWSPDGERVFFASNRGANNFDVYSQAADGSGDARPEVVSPSFHAPNSFSPDGTQLIVNEDFRDLSVADLRASTVTPLLRREAIDWLGELSPDGRWLAYESNESGQFEIYLRPFPDVLQGHREKVSVDGGHSAVWGPSGSNELYYVDREGALFAVPVQLSPQLTIGRPTKLFDGLLAPQPGGRGGRLYDVSRRDGRFIVTRTVTPPEAALNDISVVLNWFEELRKLVPQPGS